MQTLKKRNRDDRRVRTIESVLNFANMFRSAANVLKKNFGIRLMFIFADKTGKLLIFLPGFYKLKKIEELYVIVFG
jgi:hypothetical protein